MNFVTFPCLEQQIDMKKLILINAIIWAFMILLSAWLFKGDENYQYLFGALLIGAGLMNSLIYGESRKAKARNCLK